MSEFGIKNPLILNHPSHKSAIKLTKQLSDSNQLVNSNNLQFMIKNKNQGELDIVMHVGEENKPFAVIDDQSLKGTKVKKKPRQ